MKTFLQFSLCALASYAIYCVGYMEGVKSVNFDMKVANDRLQSCIDVIR
jgi:hypothetical protein